MKVVAIAISLGCEWGLYNLRIVSKSSGNRIIGEQGKGIIVKGGCVGADLGLVMRIEIFFFLYLSWIYVLANKCISK